jgi:YgiT-type zinc finger domain-containing protein
MITITICPTCGSKKIKKIRRDWTDEFQGQTYTVPDLEYHECPDCGERVYDPQAMRKIEAYSPAFAKRRRGKRARATAHN